MSPEAEVAVRLVLSFTVRFHSLPAALFLSYAVPARTDGKGPLGMGFMFLRYAPSCDRHHWSAAARSMKLTRSLTQSSGKVHAASAPSSVVERIMPLPASG